MGVCCCAVVLLSTRHKEDSTSTISRTAKEDSSNDKGVGNERQEIRDVIYRTVTAPTVREVYSFAATAPFSFIQFPSLERFGIRSAPSHPSAGG